VTRSRLVVIGPVPPPRHGVTISTTLVLANPFLRERFDVAHLDTSDRRGLANIGGWDLTNLRVGIGAVARLLPLLRRGRGVVYLPISQNAPAFLRDSLFILAAKLRGWRVAAHLRGSELHELYAAASPWLRWWMRFTLARLDSLAVMGESVRETVSGLLPPGRIAVVPNGTPDPSPNGLPRDPSTVLFLSNLLPRKGVREAVDAALIVLERHPSAQFVFAGGWEDDAFEREIRGRAQPAGDRVRFLGSIDEGEKERLLLSSAMLLFPPLLPEGHPRVVLEGLAAGLPLITTDRGTIAETVGSEGAAFVLEEAAPAELADRVLRLLGDDALRARMGEAARARFVSEYTQEAADRRLADWLFEVAR
jgi:glycosyltransferase involved in cell wall biosynthesis